MKAVRFRGLSIQILRPRLKVNIIINERVYESVGEIRPSRFQPSGRTSTEREIQKRIMGPRAAAASIKKARLVSAFTLVNKVSEN